MRTARVICLVAGANLLTLLPIATLRAQVQALRIPYNVTCAACTVVVEKVVELGGPRGGDNLSTRPVLQRDSRGRYYTLGADDFIVVAFDGGGAPITTFGRRGQGPGELPSRVQFLRVGPRDSLFVFHDGLQVSVFSPTYSFVRAFQTPAGTTRQNVEMLADGRIVLSAWISRPATAGLPFHSINGNGAILRSFGVPADIRPDQPLQTRALLFRLDKSNSSIWHFEMDAYRFEQWSLDGTLMRKVDVINVPWFKGVPQADAARGRGRGGSTASLLAVGSGNRLWVQGADSRGPLIDIVDVARAEVIASWAVPRPIKPFHFLDGDDLAYTIESAPNGDVTITVYRMSVRSS